MTFAIPYNYQQKENKPFSLMHLNDGFVLCRKLGWEPVGILFGKSEVEQCHSFCHTGAGAQGLRGIRAMCRRMKTPLTCTKAESELSFLCDTSRKFNLI